MFFYTEHLAILFKEAKMNRTLEGVFKFVRWVVAGIISLIAALPIFTSVSASM